MAAFLILCAKQTAIHDLAFFPVFFIPYLYRDRCNCKPEACNTFISRDPVIYK
jgi:hypothetical protein